MMFHQSPTPFGVIVFIVKGLAAISLVSLAWIGACCVLHSDTAVEMVESAKGKVIKKVTRRS